MKERLDRLFPLMKKWRRHFHQYPERSFQERETSEKVAGYLKSLNLEVKTGVGGYGVTGFLKGKGEGPTVALRADMDALPIQDEKTCEYRSTVPGVMHACGHDGHMAMLMGAAALLSELREELRGNVLFLFQPAEELVPGGAKAMIEAGVLEGVDVIYGAHLWTPLPLGTVGSRPGVLMAAADAFRIEIKGRGGHAGLPHESVDAVQIAAHLVVHLQSIISREVNPLEPAVISVGMIQAGQTFNVIAEHCRLEGTVRTFNEEVRRLIVRRMKEVTESTCRMYGADCEFYYEWGYPAVSNESRPARELMDEARKIDGVSCVKEMEPLMAGEDFSYYLKERPGAFCFIGAGNEQDFRYPHHHPMFDFDERAMKIGVELFMRLALREMGMELEEIVKIPGQCQE